MRRRRRGSHTVFEIQVHVCWVTKYRCRVLVGDMAERLRELVCQVCERNDVRILRDLKGIKKAKAPTTACQLRAGIDHLFPKVKNTRPLMLDNVGLSYVELGGPGNAAKPPRCLTTVVGTIELFVQLEGLIDIEGERARLEKQRAEVERFIRGVESALHNEAFRANAPEQVVQQGKDRAGGRRPSCKSDALRSTSAQPVARATRAPAARPSLPKGLPDRYMEFRAMERPCSPPGPGRQRGAEIATRARTPRMLGEPAPGLRFAASAV